MDKEEKVSGLTRLSSCPLPLPHFWGHQALVFKKLSNIAALGRYIWCPLFSDLPLLSRGQVWPDRILLVEDYYSLIIDFQDGFAINPNIFTKQACYLKVRLFCLPCLHGYLMESSLLLLFRWETCGSGRNSTTSACVAERKLETKINIQGQNVSSLLCALIGLFGYPNFKFEKQLSVSFAWTHYQFLPCSNALFILNIQELKLLKSSLGYPVLFLRLLRNAPHLTWHSLSLLFKFNYQLVPR